MREEERRREMQTVEQEQMVVLPAECLSDGDSSEPTGEQPVGGQKLPVKPPLPHLTAPLSCCHDTA